MSEDTRATLRLAFDAIEAGDLETARGILEPILLVEPNNADVWWVFSHAVTNPEEAMIALENVVRVDPNYPQAAELLDTLRQRLPRRPTLQSLPAQPPSLPQDIPDLPPDSQPDFDLEQTPPSGMRVTTVDEPDMSPDEAEEAPRSNLLPVLAGVLLVIVVIILLLSVLSQSQTPAASTATPTVVAVASPVVVSPLTTTEEPTSVSQAAETNEPEQATTVEVIGETPTEAATVIIDSDLTDEPSATGEPAAEETQAMTGALGVDALLSGLGRYALADEAITEQETSLGSAVLVNVCVSDRREVTALLRPIMRAVARGASAVETDAVGARMLNCETGTPFITMAVDRQSAMDHAAGTLSYVEFRELWEPQR